MALVKCRECGREMNKKASACPGCGAPIKTTPSRLRPSSGVILAGLIAFSVWLVSNGGGGGKATVASQAAKVAQSSSVTVSKPTTSSEESAAAKKQREERFEKCRGKLKQAQQLGLLYNMDLKRGLPKVWVREPDFDELPIDAKEGFADTVNCFLMVGRNTYITFDLLDSRSSKVVATYSAGRLTVK